jgi:hypothetical protein
MKIFLISCLVFLTLTVSIAYGHPHKHRFNNNELVGSASNSIESSETNNDDFDYLIFRQIWPQPTCMFPGQHSCSIAKNISTWVVHGLW